MVPTVKLAFVIHNHQPVGNFDGVFEQAYEDSYLPFLDVLSDFPEISVSLHTSGSLLEWLVSHHPEYVDRVRSFVERGQMEILGGPFYEPILSAIPRRDRVGQMKLYTRYLEQTFGTTVKGMWVPERVWEPTFASDIVEGGIDYTILDDSHFRLAGLPPEDLHGYYVTEDEGRLLKIFPDDETLRYAIPWKDPEFTIDYLRGMAEQHPGTIVSFGDDGEKFGAWPGTKQHVFTDGWLRRFFEALVENRSWLKVITLAEAVRSVAPLGRAYLPNASYREMTEWALPTDQQQAYHEMVAEREHDDGWDQVKPFLRAGFWRNFLVKYPESNEMYCRSREISERLERLAQTPAAQERPDLLLAARTELYRGQCNCPYWHGAFGGLYLPHLRNAIYRHLIAADTALDQLEGRTGRWTSIEAADFNLDARKEVRMAGDRLVAYLAPARGGHLYELDVRATRVNLLATLNRRPEPYHQKVLEAAAQAAEVDDLSLCTHEGVRLKQAGLDEIIHYDTWPRKSLVDHFLAPDANVQQFRAGEGSIGDFVLGVYGTRLRESKEGVEAVLTRTGTVGEAAVTVTKTVSLTAASGSALSVRYDMEGLPAGQTVLFGVEFNFASMAAGADDRYFYDASGQPLGRLESELSLDATDRLGLVDEWLGLDVALEFDTAANVWTFPIQTVSQSEGGFEKVHQSCTVVPHWQITADAEGRWSTQIQLSVDSSAAQAKQLAEAAATR